MAVQCVHAVDGLPEGSLEACAQFMADHLPAVRAEFDRSRADALVIVLPPAGRAHDDWRRSLARDLARDTTPRRANVVAGEAGDRLEAVLDYLGGAPGVTGHYVQAHD